MRSRPITLIRSYAEPLAFRLFTTDRSRFATADADLSNIAKRSGCHLGLRFDDLIHLKSVLYWRSQYHIHGR